MPTPQGTAASCSAAIRAINTHANYAAYQNVEQVTGALKALGIESVRDGMHFWPNQDAFNVNATTLRGFNANLCLVCDPSENLGPITCALFNEFAWATQRLKIIEGPNEVDMAGSITTTPLFQQSIWTAKNTMAQGLSVGIQVAAPSLANTGNAVNLGNLSASCDLGNLHAYPMGSPNYLPEGFLPGLLAQVKTVCGTHPVIVTEAGYYTEGGGKVSETAQAKYLPRMQLSYYAAGAHQIYTYELLDQEPANTVTDPQLHFGLIHADGTEKLAYQTLKNLYSIIGSGSAGSLTALDYTLSGPAVSSVLLQSGSTWLLCLWQPISCYDLTAQQDIVNPDAQVTLNLPRALPVAVYKPLLQAEEIVSYSATKSVNLSISDHVSIIKIG